MTLGERREQDATGGKKLQVGRGVSVITADGCVMGPIT